MVGLVVAAVLVSITADPTTLADVDLGRIILLTLGAAAAFGPHTSRFPVSGADVVWLYRSPVGPTALVAGEWCWVAGRRLLMVAVAGLLLVAGRTPVDVAIEVTILVGLLAILSTFVTLGAVVTRGHRWRQRSSIVIGSVLVVLALGPVLLAATIPAGPMRWLETAAIRAAAGIGTTLRTGTEGVGWMTLAGLAGLGFASCLSAGQTWRRHVRADAVFWADTDLDQIFGNRSFSDVGSLPAAQWAAGPWALAWFELAVLRRRRYQLGSAASFLATGAALTFINPDLALLAVTLVVYSYAATAAMSGLAQHLRLRTLHVPQGSLVRRVTASELVSIVPTAIDIAAAFAGIALVDRSLAVWLLPEVPVLVAMLVAVAGLRILCVAASWRPGRRLPVPALMRRLLTVTLLVPPAIVAVEVLVGALAALACGVVIGLVSARLGTGLLAARGAPQGPSETGCRAPATRRGRPVRDRPRR